MDPCSECGSGNRVLDTRRDEWTCNACGLVEPAHTAHAARTAEPAPAKGRLAGRLAATQKRALQVSSSEQRMRDAIAEARRIAGLMGCPPDVADRAGRILARARKQGLTQGRDLRAMAAAALLVSCRMLQLVRTPKEVAAATSTDEQQVQAAYKALVQGLRLPVPSASAFHYLPQLASAVGLPPITVGHAEQRLRAVCGTERAAGKSPIGWAAAALLLEAKVAGIPLTAQRMAQAAGVSASTIATRIKDLEAIGV